MLLGHEYDSLVASVASFYSLHGSSHATHGSIVNGHPAGNAVTGSTPASAGHDLQSVSSGSSNSQLFPITTTDESDAQSQGPTASNNRHRRTSSSGSSGGGRRRFGAGSCGRGFWLDERVFLSEEMGGSSVSSAVAVGTPSSLEQHAASLQTSNRRLFPDSSSILSLVSGSGMPINSLSPMLRSPANTGVIGTPVSRMMASVAWLTQTLRSECSLATVLSLAYQPSSPGGSTVKAEAVATISRMEKLVADACKAVSFGGWQVDQTNLQRRSQARQLYLQ